MSYSSFQYFETGSEDEQKIELAEGIKIKSAFEIKGQKITMDLVLEETKDKKIQYRPDDFNALLDSVATSFHVSRSELLSSIRKKEFALARHVAMYLLKEVRHLSIMKIADFFEKDHSSVIHAIARIKKQIEMDKKMKIRLEALITKNTI